MRTHAEPVPVVLESPFAASRAGTYSQARAVQYARAAMADCLARGEAPFASHLLYTQPGVLDDDKPEERELGIIAGFAWRRYAAKTVVYTDLGISSGMEAGIEHAESLGRIVIYRTLPGWSS